MIRPRQKCNSINIKLSVTVRQRRHCSASRSINFGLSHAKERRILALVNVNSTTPARCRLYVVPKTGLHESAPAVTAVCMCVCVVLSPVLCVSAVIACAICILFCSYTVPEIETLIKLAWRRVALSPLRRPLPVVPPSASVDCVK